jgi:integrase
MGWEEAYAYWGQHMRVAQMSPETTRTWASYLRRFGRDVPDPVAASHRDIIGWLDAHPHWSKACQKSARGALSSFFRLMLAEDVIARNPMLRVPPARQRLALPRPASEAQVAAGLRAWDADTRLMVALAGKGGLRRSEVAGLRGRDLVPGGVVVRGKGDKERLVPLDAATRGAILARGPGYVFPGRFAGHVHPSTVYRRVKGASRVSPHPLRHRFASRAYDATGDLLAVQQLLGHASPATTQRYVLLGRGRLEAAASAAWPVGRDAA